MAFYGAVFSVYRYAREIAYVLVCACKLIEERRFSAVLVSYERICELCALRERIFIFF